MSEKLMTLDELEAAFPADFRNPIYTPEEEARLQLVTAEKRKREQEVIDRQQAQQRLENPCKECHAINYEDCDHCSGTGIEPDSDEDEEEENG